MSIKECLEAFVAHVQALREEDEAGDDGYTKEFQMLKQQSNQYRMEGTFPTCEGEREYNRRKNRYKDILPFDYTRVILPTIPGLLGSDYINANFIKGATGEKAYIASQGPLTHTVADFWRMIWDNKVKVIIMTANEYEGGKMKCACYWPKTPEERQYGDVSVTLMEEKERGSKDFIIRQLCAKKGQEVRILQQLHYIAWPDHAIPSSVSPLLEMVALARDIQPEDLPPLLVHCSAGCGRTGTLCSIDYAWTLLKMGQITAELSLYEIVYEMRRQRPSSVQALDQYVLVHQAVSQLFSGHLTLINQHYNLSDNATSATTRAATPRAEEAHYENILSPAFLDTSLDLPEVSVSGPASLNEDHYANISATTNDIVQKAIRDTVTTLIHAASTAGIQLVPLSGQKSELRYAPSPRIRARRSNVENGYAHIQLKHPLPIPRKSRMERNSSSSSSRSSTSSISGGGGQAETLPREPIKSEPDYAVLSQFQSGPDVPTGPTGTPIILQADGGEFMNTGKKAQNNNPQKAEYVSENPCIVFTSPGAALHSYENVEPQVVSPLRDPLVSVTNDHCVASESFPAEVNPQAVRTEHGALHTEHSAMQTDMGTMRSEYRTIRNGHGTIQSEHGVVPPEHGTIRSEHGTMRAEHGTMRSEHGTMRSEHGTMRSEHGTMRCEHGTMRSEHGTMRSEYGTMQTEHGTMGTEHGTLSSGDQWAAPTPVGTCSSPHSSQTLEVGGDVSHVKMEVNPLYEDAQSLPSYEGGVMMEDNVLYERSSASVRTKWHGAPHSPGHTHSDIPAASPHIPLNVHTDAHATQPRHQGVAPPPPKSPMISTDGICRPEPEQGRKPLPLPKPKTSPTSPDRSASLCPQQQGDVYALPERRTPTTSSASSPVPANYSYADPNSLGRWSLQHVARGVPFDAVLEDGDYAQLKNPCRAPAVSPSSGTPTVPPRSTSAGQYEDVSSVGAYGFSGNGQRESLSDDESPEVPPKSHDIYQTSTGEQGQMSRSLDTLSESVTTGVLTFGRKLKQKVQQTFGKTPGSPPEGLMLGSPPGTSGSDPPHNTRGMSIFYKGMDISFPHRVPAPHGPRQQTGVTSPDGQSRSQSTRH